MPALDGLRAVAIMLVLLVHTVAGWPMALYIYEYPRGSGLALPAWLEQIGGSGWHGVSLFFVISAFTLTLRAARDDGGVPAYAIRRIARIAPGFWLAGLVYLFLGGLGPRGEAPNGIGATDIVVGLLFGGAWDGGAALAVVPGGWSVSCEASFYVALPFLLRLIDGKVWRAVLITAACFAMAQLRLRHALLNGGGSIGFLQHPLEQAPVFLCGVTAAIVASRYRMPRLPGVAAILLTLAVALPVAALPRWWIAPHLAFALLVACATALVAARPDRILGSSMMRTIGEVSYSIYLVHFALLAPCLFLACRLFPSQDWRTLAMYYPLTLGASVAISLLTYRFVEKPWIDAAKRVTSKRAAVAAPASS